MINLQPGIMTNTKITNKLQSYYFDIYYFVLTLNASYLKLQNNISA